MPWHQRLSKNYQHNTPSLHWLFLTGVRVEENTHLEYVWTMDRDKSNILHPPLHQRAPWHSAYQAGSCTAPRLQVSLDAWQYRVGILYDSGTSYATWRTGATTCCVASCHLLICLCIFELLSQVQSGVVPWLLTESNSIDETKGVSMLSTAIAFVPYQVSVYTILRLASLVKAVRRYVQPSQSQSTQLNMQSTRDDLGWGTN